MIRVRFVTGDDGISFAIRTMEYGFWASHAEVIMPDDAPRFAGTWLGAHLQGGVAARPAGYDQATMAHQQIVALDAPADQEKAFHDFIADQVGKPYDLEAIMGIVAQRDWRDDDKWFCSELVAAGFEHCGFFPPLAANCAKVTPRDLLLILSARVKLQT